MEVVQGKSTDKKIVVAQEIAFAKVLAGNNKTLRDRAMKKLKKWLTLRGNGKWEFTEDEFLRIWTGLFYCMWMSDKFLVQEELAECISKLIHCFKKNTNSALLFIKCFHKRILIDWEGLDQYRIDKFNMLVRRFLRQTFVYCREKDWDKSLLNKLTRIFYNEVLNRDKSLGYVLHFISIYAQEMAKVGKGKLDNEIVLILIEPFVKLLARTTDARIRKEVEDFFIYLMKQTDEGIEFEEKFNAWKEQGFPGAGLDEMGKMEVENGDDEELENGNGDISEEREDEEDLSSKEEVLDPRAGSVHVLLPQIPIDVDGFINLFKKYQNTKNAQIKGRKLLKALLQKYETLRKGRFPIKVKKPPILMTKFKKKQSVKVAKDLLQFTEQLESGPIQTKEFKKLTEELEKDIVAEGKVIDEKSRGVQQKVEVNGDAEEEEEDDDDDDDVNGDDVEDEEEELLEINYKGRNNIKKKKSLNKKKLKNLTKENSVSSVEKILNLENKKLTKLNKKNTDQNKKEKKNLEKRKKKKKSSKAKQEEKSTQQILANQCIVVTPKKNLSKELNNEKTGSAKKDIQKATPVQKAGMKHKILSNWQVQELDTSSPEYYKLETQKVIKIEKKLEEASFLKENEPENASSNKMNEDESETKSEKKQEKIESFTPVFWEKAKAKANKLSGKKSKVFVNPFAKNLENSTTPNRRISFALDRNMAQENEEYLEEVKNSPRVPFDGTKKPVQSALKRGLAPSPINPFHRFKKVKLNM